MYEDSFLKPKFPEVVWKSFVNFRSETGFISIDYYRRIMSFWGCLGLMIRGIFRKSLPEELQKDPDFRIFSRAEMKKMY